MSDGEEYTTGEVLLSCRAFWAIRSYAGGLDTVSCVRMLDVARAYERLSTDDKRLLFEGVWLERAPVPRAVITKMRHYLNGD